MSSEKRNNLMTDYEGTKKMCMDESFVLNTAIFRFYGDFKLFFLSENIKLHSLPTGAAARFSFFRWLKTLVHNLGRYDVTYSCVDLIFNLVWSLF